MFLLCVEQYSLLNSGGWGSLRTLTLPVQVSSLTDVEGMVLRGCGFARIAAHDRSFVIAVVSVPSANPRQLTQKDTWPLSIYPSIHQSM